MSAMVFIGPEALDDEGLARWIDVAVGFAATPSAKTRTATLRRVSEKPSGWQGLRGSADTLQDQLRQCIAGV